MTSNHGTVADETGTYQDWVELYNPGSVPVDLVGMYISDDPLQPLKHQINESLMVPAQGSTLLWASGANFATGLHLNFSLSIDGAFLVLTAADGMTVLDNIQIPPQQTDVSYGRATDGSSEWRFFELPTPLASNNTSEGSLGILQTPTFSIPSGFHTGPQQLILTSSDPGVTILYSLDGSVPTMERLNGEGYSYKNQFPELPGQPYGPLLQDTMRAYVHTGPIQLTDISNQPNILSARNTTYAFEQPAFIPNTPVRKANVVRARAFKEGYIPSPVATHTYFIDQNGSLSINLPVLSIITDKDNLFDYQNGIYTAGETFDWWRSVFPAAEAYGQVPANWSSSREVPISMEWFDENSTAAALSLNAGMRLHGSFSRSLKRKSLRLYFRSLYGQSELDHAIFPAQPDTRYKRLLVHNAGNDEPVANLRDMTLQAMMKHMHLETMEAWPLALFLNGEYWGIQTLRERYNRHFLERTQGIQEGELDMLELQGLTPIEGDAQHYQALMDMVSTADMTQDAVLDQVATMMDLENFIDFQIAHIFTGNTDWPQNNVRMYRKRTPAYVPNAPYGHDGRWRWLLFDLDFGFNLAGNIPAGLQFLERATMEEGFGVDPQYTLLMRRLLLNQRFRDMFINRSADMINTAFQVPVTASIIDAHRDLISAGMQEHFTRWPDGPGSMAQWLSNLEVMYTFAQERPAAFRNELLTRFSMQAQRLLTLSVSDAQAGYVHVNTIDILPSTHGVDQDPYPWTGIYFQGAPVTLSAKAMPGFEFLHWTGAVESTEPQITVTLTQATSLMAVFGPVPFCQDEVVHYWHFNDLPSGTLTGVLADTNATGSGRITYAGGGAGYLDRTSASEGTLVNAVAGTPAGRALRVRNPSSDRSIIIEVPATGFRDIKLSFATMRTSSGAEMQQVFYTIDPEQADWTSLGDPYLVITNYMQHSFSLDGVVPTYDHEYLAFKVEFMGESSTNITGNARFDNVLVTGRPMMIVDEEFCEGEEFTYNGITYQEPGQYLHLTEAMDCGSHIMFRLSYPDIDTVLTLVDGGAVAMEGADQYQWLDCNQNMAPISGANMQLFEPEEAGIYAVEITRSSCTAVSGCYFIALATGITVYPNPVQHDLFVDLMNAVRPSEYLLYDNAGRLVRSGAVTASRMVLDMRSMAAGVYILELRGESMTRFRIVR